MTFVLTTLPKRLIIFGIAAYAADIVFVSNIASLLEGWYMEHLSWHWIFWNAALFSPVMMRINQEELVLAAKDAARLSISEGQ